MTYEEKKSLYEAVMLKFAKELKKRLNEDFGNPRLMTNPISMHDFIEKWDEDGKIDGIKVRPFCSEEVMEEIKKDAEKTPGPYKEGGWDGTQYYCVFGRWGEDNMFVSDEWDYKENILGKEVSGSHGVRGFGSSFWYINYYEHGYLVRTGVDSDKKSPKGYVNWLLVMDDYVQSRLDLDITR